jgi:alkylated DNA repair dioxygenase AlkB
MKDESRLIVMEGAAVMFNPSFLPKEEADTLFRSIIGSTHWKQEFISIYGRSVKIPRLTAWHGDEGKRYSYSGIAMNPERWTTDLRSICERIEPIAKVKFNSVLLNLYRDEKDSVSWHSDDEPHLGQNPVIASVSLGATRRFQFKHKDDPDKRETLELTHGSLLLMGGATQHNWQHQVPKSSSPCQPRINLTFRVIK